MALGQLGRAAGADRTAVGWRKPSTAIPLIAYHVPV